MAFLNSAFDKVFRRNKDIWKTDLFVVGVFLLITLIYLFWQPKLPTREEIEQLTYHFGSIGPLAIIGVIIVETVIAPIPGAIIPIAVGALYGIWPGILYVWIGDVAGSIIAFWISRKLGRPVVEKIINSKKIDHYDKFLHRNQLFIWLIYIVPIFPIDMISFVIGLSKISFKRFLYIVGVGFVLNLLILTFFGDQLITASGTAKMWYAIIIMVVILVTVSIEKKVFRKD
ncbi:VTT domain-containing protein [Patescibacteria group bacterium]|nr:VTT domain-containing protein [Patescibacteria group bacterium]MBU0964384.1 VTT domain-containing protein [Patescibacteria group bacterium]